jgi:hypothetical protein
MELRSHIDWNELFPHFKKELRETLMLEAVTILSGRRPSTTTAAAAPKPVKHRIVRAAKPTTRYKRRWSIDGTGGRLAHAGRVYRIVLDPSLNYPSPLRPNSKLATLWNVLSKHKTETVTYEGMVDLCDQIDLGVHATIANMWSMGLLEVVIGE